MSSDIYGMREPPVSNRRKREAVSQRRDEYLRATGAEPVPHHQHHPRRHHRQSLGKKIVLFGLGLLGLLAALGIMGAVLSAARNGLAADGSFPEKKLILNGTKAR